MITMLIADDEPIITKGIKKLIDWKQFGIEIVGEYQEGASALHHLITQKVDIALLDISMPEKTGIEIISELRELELETQVVFISGFQDFEYAREALSKGAVEYLLKPINKEELLKAIERCTKRLPEYKKIHEKTEESMDFVTKSLPQELLLKLSESEKTVYRTVIFELLFDRAIEDQEVKLIRFSLMSLLNVYMEKEEKGIFFMKEDKFVTVFKGLDLQHTKEAVRELIGVIEQKTKHKVGAVIGNEVDRMSQIPSVYQKCKQKMEILFFFDLLKNPIAVVDEVNFRRSYTVAQMTETRNHMVELLISGEDEQWEKEFHQLVEVAGVLANGNKEEVNYYFHEAVRNAYERLHELKMSTDQFEMKEIMERSRISVSYREMTGFYFQIFQRARNLVQSTMLSHEKKDILSAKRYMEEHYMENLSLEVMANYIHMNPYYFSSFFKKQTGENYKDYLNRIRMEKAMDLLLSTDKKSYEIAMEVGLNDEKHFSKLFQRYYGLTPAQYKKSRLGKG
ncbi:MAG: response regulator [Vallitaleaceae bacterium]|nr:response regulator [Vallitaleaceae bacterium]